MRHPRFHSAISGLRVVIGGALILATYLCLGAAWKVWMVMRYPAVGPSFNADIREAMRPYSELPVGYVMGSAFGEFAAGVRLQYTDSSPAGSKRAAEYYRWVVRSQLRRWFSVRHRTVHHCRAAASNPP